MSAQQLHVTISGAQGSGKSRLASKLIDAAHDLGFGVDLKQEGVFVGGTMRQPTDDRPRILIEEVQT